MGIVQTTEADFGELSKVRPVLVKFGAEWCHPCRALGPVLEYVSRDYAGRLTVMSVDIDDAPHLARMYMILSVPTLILFKDGEMVEHRSAVTTRGAVDRLLAPHL